MSRPLLASFVLAVACLVPSAGARQVDLDRLGPAVGAAAPAFTLRDHAGREQTLASLAGPSGTWLVFSRSADW